MLGNLGMNIWSACMTSPNDYIPFIISRWLGGSFGSAPSTIGAGIILDIFYLHQRGKGEYEGFGASNEETNDPACSIRVLYHRYYVRTTSRRDVVRIHCSYSTMAGVLLVDSGGDRTRLHPVLLLH